MAPTDQQDAPGGDKDKYVLLRRALTVRKKGSMDNDYYFHFYASLQNQYVGPRAAGRY